MRLLARAILVGTLLLLANPLGSPGEAATEPPEFSLLDEASRRCDQATNAGPLEPEALSVCISGVTGDAVSVSPSVKQPEAKDGSIASNSSPVMQSSMSSALVEELPRAVPGLSVASLGPSVKEYRVEDNHDVRRFLDQFQTGYRRAVVERWLVRAGQYLPMVLDVFKQKGLPEELVFTAMIESGFDPLAVSRAGAKGLWQFMAPTARRYGLRVDNWLDERLDPEKSTVAAARHFVDLYAVFGSWNLAQAAYNAGERTVLEAIRAMGTSDFWALARGRWLADETKNFIPAIQAATLIAREPERYGFVITPASPLAYEVVTVPKSTSLKQFATRTGLDPDALERLNPELRLRQTPPDGPYRLKVPVNSAAAARVALERETAPPYIATPVRSASHGLVHSVPMATKPAIHVVKRQETVASIAKRYGISPADIVRWNDLGDKPHIVPGAKLRVAATAGREENQGRSK